MIQRRSLGLTIGLSIVTFGIYGLYWIYKLAQDTNTICDGDGKNTSGLLKYILLGTVTLGIYCCVWVYALCERLRSNGVRYQLDIKEGGLIVLLWMIPGSIILVGPFIAMNIIIKNINVLAYAYNNKKK